MSNALNTTSCPFCKSDLAIEAKFCSQCGSAVILLPKQKLNIQQFFIIVVVALILGGSAYSLQPWFQGKPPTQVMAKVAAPLQTSNVNAPEPSGTPLSAEELFSKAESTMQKIAESDTPDPATMLEAVDLLSRILSAEPENAWALLQMAELAFEQRIFDKSSEFYARYLKVTPEDSAVRTRYASALTFSGKIDQALVELNSVLATEPNNFQALAFAAIANQQSGQKAKAQELLAKAVIAAPSDEAKNRLLKFAQTLDKKEETSATQVAQTNTVDSATPSGLSPARGNLESGNFSALDNFFKNHPIAGPKYAGLTVKGSEIRVSFNSFPMAKMPPMVKDKFSNNTAIEVKKESKGQPYTLVFVDAATGAEMHRVEVR